MPTGMTKWAAPPYFHPYLPLRLGIDQRRFACWMNLGGNTNAAAGLVPVQVGRSHQPVGLGGLRQPQGDAGQAGVAAFAAGRAPSVAQFQVTTATPHGPVRRGCRSPSRSRIAANRHLRQPGPSLTVDATRARSAPASPSRWTPPNFVFVGLYGIGNADSDDQHRCRPAAGTVTYQYGPALAAPGRDRPLHRPSPRSPTWSSTSPQRMDS